MRKYWLIMLTVTAISFGCGPQESPERSARDAEQDEKVRAALEKQKRGNMSMPPELKPDETDGENQEAESAPGKDDSDTSNE